MFNGNNFISLLFVLFCVFMTSTIVLGQVAQEIVGDEFDKPAPQSLNKSASIFDRSVGFLNVGALRVNGIESYGVIGRSYQPYIKHGYWGELRWVVPILGVPKQSWATDIQHEDGPTVDRSSYYNCIESYTQYFCDGGQEWSFVDWESVDNAGTQLIGDDTHSNTPLTATSTRPRSWPEGYFDENNQFIETPGERHWPGYWALDPDPESETFGLPIDGQFVSSQDIYFKMDDKYNGIRLGDETGVGYPIGFMMEVSGYAYAARAYEDIVFFNYNLIYQDNITDPTYQHHNKEIDSLYFGFVFDPDLPGRTYLPGTYQMTPWAEDDYCKPYLERNLFVMFDKAGYAADDNSIAEGPVSTYGLAYLKTPPDDVTGEDIGLTGFHFFDQEADFAQISVGAQIERSLYAMMSGDPSILSPDDVARYFHGENPHFDDLDLLRPFHERADPGNRIDIQFIISSGPFTAVPGDTMPIHVCLLAGVDNYGTLDADGFATNLDDEDRFADILLNFEKALDLYNNKFQGTGPPRTPTLSAVGTKTFDANGIPIIYTEDGKVTLYWDSNAEETRDILTKEKDFQGYKIYKSFFDPTSDIVDWGIEVYEVNNVGERGELLGYEPVFQCDKIDGIDGLDPFNPYMYLGDNTGIVHTWTDTDVENGVRYGYTIIAYDRPYLDLLFPANESPRGSSGKDFNTINAIPGKRPLGFTEGTVDSTFEHVSGTGTGSLELEIFDSDALTGNTYKVTFDDTSSSVLEYSIYNETLGKIVDLIPPNRIFTSGNIVEYSSEEAPNAHPIVDGWALKIVSDDLAILDDPLARVSNQGWTAVSGTASTSEFEVTKYYKAALAADYEVRFLGANADTSTIGSKTLPFQIWNVSKFPPVKVDMFLQPRTGDFSDNDLIIFNETADGKYTQTWALRAHFVPADDTTGMEPVAPAVGDVYTISFSKPFTHDVFRFSTTAVSSQAFEENELDNIRVVPNPYVITTEAELYTGESTWDRREIRFTNLPPNCTIKIYTVMGDHVKTIEHNSITYGEARWDLLTKENLEVSYGIYLYIVETDSGEQHIGKFAIVL